MGPFRRALLLDRDGVINHDFGHVGSTENFLFIDGIFELVRTANEFNWVTIVVTNQSGIGRGYYTEDQFLKLTDWMLTRFSSEGCLVEKVYWCPFHPEHGVGQYKLHSFERKPNPGLIFRARDEMKLDLADSILVGDKDSDMIAGKSAGVGCLIQVLGSYDASDSANVYVENLQDILPYLSTSK